MFERSRTIPWKKRVWRTWIAMAMVSWAFSGCAAYKWHAVPARCVKPSLPEQPRGSKEPINFIRLRQDPPPVYMLGPRDILGIYIEGVLGKADEAPPVHFSEKSDLPPALGFPVPIREDGTLALPLVPPLKLAGLSMAQAEELIRRAYTVDQQILRPGRDRIIVTLIKPRTLFGSGRARRHQHRGFRRRPRGWRPQSDPGIHQARGSAARRIEGL